jgi:membrane fusion protein (multidrug efflux system)
LTQTDEIEHLTDVPEVGKNKGVDGEGGKKDEKPKRNWPIILLIAGVALAVIGGLFYWWTNRGLESTDDGYTEGNAISIAPKVPGYVVELNIDDNSQVHTGDILLKIDQRDYITARDQAIANLALARAQLLSAQISLDVTKVSAPANLVQSDAQLALDKANAALAKLTDRRASTLSIQHDTSQANADQANTQLQANDATVNSDQAKVQVAALVKQTIAASEALVAQSTAQVAQAEASLAQAEVNLTYTIIRAPQDGHITRRNVDLGTFAQLGQQVFYIVTPALWITANFKETQLNLMRPGQKVSITVDAYPELKLQGHVDSIQAGSGDRFSTFPAENATGNYVKIVRRVPVKIVIDSGIDKLKGLPLGLSVTPTVIVE